MLHGHAHVGVAVEFYESEGAFSNTDIDYAMDKFLVPAGFATNQEIAAHAPTPFKAQMASKAARLERSGARGARGERDRDGNWVQQSGRAARLSSKLVSHDAGVDVRSLPER